jgi:hypothetical protein
MDKDAPRAFYDEIGDLVSCDGPPVALGDDVEAFSRQLLAGLARVIEGRTPGASECSPDVAAPTITERADPATHARSSTRTPKLS